VISHIGDDIEDGVWRGVEVIVNGCADDDDDRARSGDHGWILRCPDPSLGHAPCERAIRMGLAKRHPTGLYLGHGFGIGVDQLHAKAAFGQADTQRETDPSAAS
jgi:hypothetical protein